MNLWTIAIYEVLCLIPWMYILSLPHVAYCRKVLSPVLATVIRIFTSSGIVSSGTNAMSDRADIDALVMISGSVHTMNRAL